MVFHVFISILDYKCCKQSERTDDTKARYGKL